MGALSSSTLRRQPKQLVTAMSEMSSRRAPQNRFCRRRCAALEPSLRLFIVKELVTPTFLYGVNIRANGVRQHVLRFGGAGRPLLLVPGITSPAPTWAFVGEWFGRRFDTYVLDVRGRGLSEHGSHLDYSLEACAADVLALAQALGFDRFHLVGHSMGARIVALAATVGAPGVDRIVMVDPPVSGPGRRPYPSPLKVYVASISPCPSRDERCRDAALFPDLDGGGTPPAGRMAAHV